MLTSCNGDDPADDPSASGNGLRKRENDGLGGAVTAWPLVLGLFIVIPVAPLVGAVWAVGEKSLEAIPSSA